MVKVKTPGLTWSYAKGAWHQGNIPIMGTLDDGAWLGHSTFDGARYFERVAPDLKLHCERSIRSAQLMDMEPKITAKKLEATIWEGINKFDIDSALYICIYFYLQENFFRNNDEATEFSIAICEAPMPEPDGFSACLTRFRRPSRDVAPTEAKAACLYPNVRRSMVAANKRGFDQAVMLDPNGNVAEFTWTNLFMVKDNIVSTPAINGTFLNGITRQRVIWLLKDAGYCILERTIQFEELLDADEIFSTANYSKIQPCIKIEGKEYGVGPVYTLSRKLYFEWARQENVK